MKLLVQLQLKKMWKMQNNFKNINVCPATLQIGYNTYSPKAIKDIFNGEKVSHILPFVSPSKQTLQDINFIEKRKRISISGVQEKYSLKLENQKFSLTEKQGNFILKPIPTDVLLANQVPLNEHLTMQIAEQVYKLNVAKCAIIFFADGEPAYITKRFDVMPNGKRCLKEDFASLAQLSSQNAGINYKYNFSYAQMANIMDDYFPAAIPAKEQFFRLIIFNYLFSNGDAHLKNFIRIDCEGKGDGHLAPAYDLLNTYLHTRDGFMALENGLYEKDFEHTSFSKLGYYGYNDFVFFGEKIGLLNSRIRRMMDDFLQHTPAVEKLINQSFLNNETKLEYFKNYQQRLQMLSTKI